MDPAAPLAPTSLEKERAFPADVGKEMFAVRRNFDRVHCDQRLYDTPFGVGREQDGEAQVLASCGAGEVGAIVVIACATGSGSIIFSESIGRASERRPEKCSDTTTL